MQLSLIVFGIFCYLIFWGGLWFASVDYLAELCVNDKINSLTYAVLSFLSFGLIVSINVGIISTLGG